MIGRFPVLLLAAFFLAFAIYFPGLTGGFWFDDYGGLVYNEGLRAERWSWSEFLRGTWSYAQSGPFGRPVAMATFTIDYLVHGLDAYWAKLENVLIHLLNGGLIYQLTRCVSRWLSAPTDASERAAANLSCFVAAWWLVAPMATTSVLYVVQRMTSLSATFTLLGLLGYLHFRSRSSGAARFGDLLKASALLIFATTMSTYTKESGLLTIGYAWVLEITLFARGIATNPLERAWRGFIYVLPVCVVAAFGWFLLQHPGWLETRVAGRDFSPWQRQITEFRVLAFYLRQILFPDILQFGLYHDDFSVSRAWNEPISTAWAALLHLGLTVGALAALKRFPLLALGILWFYMGHLLESSVWPLELVHEHRNYLAMWGVMLAASGILFRLTSAVPDIRRLLALILVLAFAGVTLSRAHGMGGGSDYFVNEARLHPNSARANYDAATSLIKLVRDGKVSLAERREQIAGYLEASQAADTNALAPFLGKTILAILDEKRSEADLAEFERRLRHGVPPNAIHAIFLNLMDLVDVGSPSFTKDDLERLFIAALANPELGGTGRTSLHANYGVFLSGMRNDFDGAMRQMVAALDNSPSASDVRLHYAGMLIDAGRLDEARRQIDIARQSDKFGYSTAFADSLSRIADSREHAKQR